jgi:citrate synthase
MSDNKAELRWRGKNYEMDVVVGSENEHAVKISNLLEETELITLDPGYKNTGSTTSSITFLDGDKGILRYRGYSIEDVAEYCSFPEVIYLLLNGELPDQTGLDELSSRLSANNTPPPQLAKIFEAIAPGTHPMAYLGSMVFALSGYHNQGAKLTEENYLRLLGQFPALVAMIQRHIQGKKSIAPNAGLDYVTNFLQMTFGTQDGENEVNPVVADAMDKLLILHADHEQNCSTSTVRMAGSSNAALDASVAAGISALWGPLHGGANQSVLEMLEAIQADGGNTEKYIAKAKDKADPFRLMGFGHRVYKNFDPRARIIKKACDNVLNALGINDPILEIAQKLEEVALKDEYFISRNLYPNVDFYSGIIYKAIGFPTEMFTVLFALGRLPGWISHWKEMKEQKQPIGRPRQVYTGSPARPFVPISER